MGISEGNSEKLHPREGRGLGKSCQEWGQCQNQCLLPEGLVSRAQEWGPKAVSGQGGRPVWWRSAARGGRLCRLQLQKALHVQAHKDRPVSQPQDSWRMSQGRLSSVSPSVGLSAFWPCWCVCVCLCRWQRQWGRYLAVFLRRLVIRGHVLGR